MTVPVIEQFPPAPSRLNDPQTFVARADPTIAHLTRFVDQINAAIAYMTSALTSTSALAASATAAGTSSTAASASASASAIAAAAAKVAAELALDQFTDIYLGVKNADPTTDNDGNPLQPGAYYVNASIGYLRVWTGTVWVQSIATAIRVKKRGGDFVEVR